MDYTYYLVEQNDLDSIKQIAKNFRSQDITDEKAKTFLSSNATRVYACKNKGKVVGYLLLYILPRFDNGNDMMQIYHLFVLDSHQRHGIGETLMNMAISYAKENELHYVFLITQTENTGARKLYSKLGGYNHPENKELYYWYISGNPVI